MKARITMNMTAEGEFEIWVNKSGRDLLVAELKGLSDRNDHFHLGAFEGAEVELQDKPYRPTDAIVSAAKVLLRPDECDQRHFPHVLEEPP